MSVNDCNLSGSIINSIKKIIGLNQDYKAFDVDLIIYINSAFTVLNQLGIGPEKPFIIQDEDDQWSDFIQDDRLESVKVFVYLKTRLVFDPPSYSFTTNAIEKQIDELAWRLQVHGESI